MPGWPAGYPSRGAWVFHDITQAFDYWPRLDSLSITQLHPDGLSTCTLEVPDPTASLTFEDGDEHRITFRGSRVWAGLMHVTARDDMSAHGPRVWHLEGQDYTTVLDEDIIQSGHERPSESVASRVAWILTKLTYPGISTGGLDLPSATVEAASYEGFSVMDALEQVSDEVAMHFYVDYDKDLHMFQNEVVAAAIDLDDDAPDYSATFPYSDLSHRTDRTQMTNAVFVKGRRHKRWVLDSASIAAYGRIESAIIDDRLTTASQVQAAGQRRLNQLAEPIVDGHLTCWEPGLYAGRTFQLASVQWPDVDGTYIVTQAEITAPDGHDESGEALMRTEIGYTDRRRVGRFPGSGKDKDDKDAGGGGGTGLDPTPPGSDVGECCNPVGIGESPLTEATIGSTIVGPSFAYATGDEVLLWRGIVSPEGDIRLGHDVTDPEMAGLGVSASGRRRVYLSARVIDGTEPDDWTIGITPGEEPDAEGWLWQLIKGPITNNLTETESAIGSTSSIEGDDLDLTWLDTNIIIQRLALWESTDDEGSVGTAEPPANSTLTGSVRIDGGGDHGEIWMAASHGPVQATDPATFDAWTFSQPNGANLQCRVFRVGSPYTGPGYDVPIVQSSPVSVAIVPGPTWDGGNEGVNESTDQAGLQIEDGDIVLTSSSTGKDFVLRWTGPPDMPTQLDDWTVTLPFTLDVAGDTGDPGERYVGLIATIGGQRFAAYARLGDGVRAQGVLIRGSADTFVAKDVTEGAQMYLTVRYADGVASARMWSGSEPSTWDVTTSALEDAAGEEDSLVLDVQLGNDGAPVQTLVISPLSISGGALAGEAVDWHVVGYGDGTTVTFDTPYPYDELSLQVRVDNQQLAGSAIVDMDGAGAAFTLSNAPYGDPSDPDGSSVVEARYVRA